MKIIFHTHYRFELVKYTLKLLIDNPFINNKDIIIAANKVNNTYKKWLSGLGLKLFFYDKGDGSMQSMGAIFDEITKNSKDQYFVKIDEDFFCYDFDFINEIKRILLKKFDFASVIIPVNHLGLTYLTHCFWLKEYNKKFDKYPIPFIDLNQKEVKNQWKNIKIWRWVWNKTLNFNEFIKIFKKNKFNPNLKDWGYYSTKDILVISDKVKEPRYSTGILGWSKKSWRKIGGFHDNEEFYLERYMKKNKGSVKIGISKKAIAWHFSWFYGYNKFLKEGLLNKIININKLNKIETKLIFEQKMKLIEKKEKLKFLLNKIKKKSIFYFNY